MIRRRALLAASGGGNKLPIIPNGFFPLYLTHDSYDSRERLYIFNATDTSRLLWDIVYGYAIEYGEDDGYSYSFYPVEYGIEVYLDGYQVTDIYVYLDGHAELYFESPYVEGNINSDKSIWLSILQL